MEASSGQRDGAPFQRYLRGCPQAECTDWQESKGFQWASKCCTCSEQLAHTVHRAGIWGRGKEVAGKVNRDLSSRSQVPETWVTCLLCSFFFNAHTLTGR